MPTEYKTSKECGRCGECHWCKRRERDMEYRRTVRGLKTDAQLDAEAKLWLDAHPMETGEPKQDPWAYEMQSILKQTVSSLVVRDRRHNSGYGHARESMSFSRGQGERDNSYNNRHVIGPWGRNL